VSEHVPDDTMVMVSEETVQIFVVVEKMVGVSPEVAVGETVNVDADHKRSERELNVIEFDAWANVTVVAEEEAAS
jgi:hypothetical protein